MGKGLLDLSKFIARLGQYVEEIEEVERGVGNY